MENYASEKKKWREMLFINEYEITPQKLGE